MSSSNAPRKKGGTANKDGTSHHTFRGFPSTKYERPSTAPTGTKTNISTKRPKSSTPGQSSGNVKRKEPVSRGAEEQHTKKRACDNANVERDKEKANLQRSPEEEKHKTKITEASWAYKMKELKEKNERETRQLQVENKYLKQILDDLHKSIIVGEATLQMELKPPEDITNDKLLIELTNNTRNIHLKFNELETEMSASKQEMADKIKENQHNYDTLWAEHQNLKISFTALQKLCNEANAGTEEQHAKKRSCENGNVERDKEKAEWEKEKVYLQRCLEQEKHKTKTTETFLANKMNELQEKNESLSNGKKDNKVMQKKYNQLEQDLVREFNQKNTEFEKYCKQLTTKHTNETQQLHKTIKSLTVEKDTLLTRLSTIASERFTHDNVNIADLSDADRPTKLQEQYSELYDNEWTDAFEELIMYDNITEDDAIMILLKILMSTFHNCREITWGRYERLKTVASSIYIEEEISMPSPKVMSSFSEPVMTTQEADSSRAQLDKNDERVDQTSDTDNNLDTIQDGTASRESRTNNEMHVLNEKSFKVKGANKNEDSDDQCKSEAPKGKSDNKKGKNGANRHEASDKQSVNEAPKDKFENKKVKKGANKNEDSDDQCESEAPKDISENKKGKNGANKHEASDDQSESEAPKNEFENKKGKKGANKNEDSDDQCESEAPKDKCVNKKRKNGANKHDASDDQSVNEAPKDKFENKKEKNGASKDVESDDQSVSVVPKDKFEDKKGKNGTIEKEASDDQSVSDAPKKKFEKKQGKNGAKENVESGDINVSEAPNDKSEIKKGKHLLCTIDLNFDLMHDIKGIWRKTTLELKGIAAEPLYSVIETCLDMPFIGQPMTSKYMKSCIDLCWKMGVQQRPLHLDGFAEMNAYAGKKFDKDKFRSYTQSGSHVAFFVWPTLYLYEGGPILVKGIAQCCSPVEAKYEELS